MAKKKKSKSTRSMKQSKTKKQTKAKTKKKVSVKAKAAKAPRKVKTRKSPAKTTPAKTQAKVQSLKTPKKNPTSLQPAVEVGKSVPDFSVIGASGKEIKLSDYAGKKVILYFYPKDDTPGCTLEGQDFNRLLPEFEAQNTVVFGVSRDSVQSHCKFRDKFGFKFELLSDTDEKLCQLFDVIKEKNMYGKIVMGIERSTFVIGENSNLLAEFRKVSAQGHAEAMLDYVKNLK